MIIYSLASLKMPFFFKKGNGKRIRVRRWFNQIRAKLHFIKERAADRVTLITTCSRSRKTDFCARTLSAFCISNYHQLELRNACKPAKYHL